MPARATEEAVAAAVAAEASEAAAAVAAVAAAATAAAAAAALAAPNSSACPQTRYRAHAPQQTASSCLPRQKAHERLMPL